MGAKAASGHLELCAFRLGTKMFLSGQITAGTVLTVFWMALFGIQRLGAAIPQLRAILDARLAAAEIFKIIDEERGAAESRLSAQFAAVGVGGQRRSSVDRSWRPNRM